MFSQFPEYIGRDFYIAGESYAGIYIPTLIVRILDGMDEYPINLKGYAIGNGYMSVDFNTDSLMFFARYHSLFDDRRVFKFCFLKELFSPFSSINELCTLIIAAYGRIWLATVATTELRVKLLATLLKDTILMLNVEML